MVGYVGDDVLDGVLDVCEDVVFVVVGWMFIVFVFLCEKLLCVLGGVGVVDLVGCVIVNDVFVCVCVCVCVMDVVFVVISRGLGYFYVDGERDVETWCEYDGVDVVVVVDVDGDG